MVGLLIAVFTLLSFFLAFILYSILWGRDSQLEKYFDKAKSELTDLGYIPKTVGVKHTSVIVDSGTYISPIRTFIKKAMSWIFGKGKGSVIWVFNKPTEADQKAFLIQQAVAINFRNISLLDADLIETMINYYAFKFAQQKKGINEEIVYTLRRDFENTKFRKWLPFFDDVQSSISVVVNPPPEEKPIVFNVLLPMIRAKNLELILSRAAILKIEQNKSFFMQLTEKIYNKECGILFVGELPTEAYFKMILEHKNKFSYFILAARGTLIDRLTNLCNKIMKRCKSELNSDLDFTTINGKWDFGDHKVDCRWAICFPSAINK